MPQPLYPRGRSTQYPSDRRLGYPRAGLDDVEILSIVSKDFVRGGEVLD
jgi:hypothetical protein